MNATANGGLFAYQLRQMSELEMKVGSKSVKTQLNQRNVPQQEEVEDGKIYFTMTDSGAAGDDCCRNKIFSLKTVERVFITVTHFPTHEIKGSGKVKFLRALKERILDHCKLKKAVGDFQQLRTAEEVHREHFGHKYNEKRIDQSAFEGHPHRNTASDTDTTQRMDVCCEHQQCERKDLPLEVLVSQPDQTDSDLTLVQSSSFSDTGKESFESKSLRKRSLPTDRELENTGSGNMNDFHHCCLDGLPDKRRKLDIKDEAGNFAGSEEGVFTGNLAKVSTEVRSVPSKQKGNTVTTFRFSVKCGGWCKKWLQPQRLSKELGIRLTIMMGWTVDLNAPDMEICVHVNDDFVVVGMPLTRIPLSKRSYILDAGLRSTISWIMTSQANIQPGHLVLDPMCGKATILIEAAKEYSQTAVLMGCDVDSGQLQAAVRNVQFAQLTDSVQLFQADALNMPLKSATVDRIVCDAPFGQKFDVTSCSLPQFYKHLMQEMHRLLVPGGLAVLLTSQDLLAVVEENTQRISHSKTSLPAPSSSEQLQTQGTVQRVSKTSVLLTPGDPDEVSWRSGEALVTGHLAGDSTPLHDGDKSLSGERTSASQTPYTNIPSVSEMGETKICSQRNTQRLSNLNTDLKVSTSHHIENSSQSEKSYAEENSAYLTQAVGSPGVTDTSDPPDNLNTSRVCHSCSADSVCVVKTSNQSDGLVHSSDSHYPHQTVGQTENANVSQTVASGSMKALNDNVGRFSILSSHYVKLGETHAYIVVLQKSEL